MQPQRGRPIIEGDLAEPFIRMSTKETTKITKKFLRLEKTEIKEILIDFLL